MCPKSLVLLEHIFVCVNLATDLTDHAKRFDKGRTPLKTYLGESIPSFCQNLVSKILQTFNVIINGPMYLTDSTYIEPTTGNVSV